MIRYTITDEMDMPNWRRARCVKASIELWLILLAGFVS